MNGVEQNNTKTNNLQLLSSKETSQLAHSEKDARKKMRLLAISHFIDGKNRTEIAAILKVSRRSVNRLSA